MGLIGSTLCFAQERFDSSRLGEETPKQVGQRESTAAASLSFDKYYLPLIDQKRKLTLQVVGTSRCMFGDLDVISADLQRAADSSKLQLSVESLEASRSTVLYPSTTESAQPTGGVRRFTVDVPVFDRPTVLGIFLCLAVEKNGEKLGPCSEKALMTFAEMSKPHEVDINVALGADGTFQPAPYKQAAEYVAHEKIYFFRFVIAQEDQLLVPTSPMNEKSYAELKSYMNSIGADVKDYQSLVKRLSSLGETLGSIPLKVKGKEVLISLPYYDTKRCNG